MEYATKELVDSSNIEFNHLYEVTLRLTCVLSMEVRCHSHLSGAGAASMRYFRLSTVCCSSCSALGLPKDAAMGLALIRAARTASAGKWIRLFSCYGSVYSKLRKHILNRQVVSGSPVCAARIVLRATSHSSSAHRSYDDNRTAGHCHQPCSLLYM